MGGGGGAGGAAGRPPKSGVKRKPSIPLLPAEGKEGGHKRTPIHANFDLAAHKDEYIVEKIVGISKRCITQKDGAISTETVYKVSVFFYGVTVSITIMM